LLVTCSDSRVAPNVFASTDPGDLFVVRNVGNLIPPSEGDGKSVGEPSGPAALEFALRYLPVSNIVVCGHSECGAMIATLNGLQDDSTPNLQDWLRSGQLALERLEREGAPDPALTRHNQLSQVNALVQVEHIMTYPQVRARMEAGTLRVHAWWFDIANADVYAYEPEQGRFVLMDESEAEAIIARL
jgi:carbonic anhydrase